MTAMNLIVQPRARAVFLLTDTVAVGTRTGRVAHFCSKVIPVHVGGRTVVAVAVSGRLAPDDLAEHMQAIRPASLQDFLTRFPDAFRATERTLRAREEAGSMAAVVAAFDHNRNLPLGYAIANDNVLFPPDQRSYELKKRSRHITEFDPDDSTLRQIDFCDPRQWVPESDGERLIEAQRRDPDVRTGRFGIGGEAVLTRLDKQGLTTTVIKTWPDRIGKRIDPDGPVRPRGWRNWLAPFRA